MQMSIPGNIINSKYSRPLLTRYDSVPSTVPMHDSVCDEDFGVNQTQGYPLERCYFPSMTAKVE